MILRRKFSISGMLAVYIEANSRINYANEGLLAPWRVLPAIKKYRDVQTGYRWQIVGLYDSLKKNEMIQQFCYQPIMGNIAGTSHVFVFSGNSIALIYGIASLWARKMSPGGKNNLC